MSNPGIFYNCITVCHIECAITEFISASGTINHAPTLFFFFLFRKLSPRDSYKVRLAKVFLAPHVVIVIIIISLVGGKRRQLKKPRPRASLSISHPELKPRKNLRFQDCFSFSVFFLPSSTRGWRTWVRFSPASSSTASCW